MGTRTLTIKIPQIDGVSPMGLKKDIDYLISEEFNNSKYDLRTEVVVTPERPGKAFRSKNYTVITGASGANDSNPILSDVTVDYPEQTYVEVIMQGSTGVSDINEKICREIKQYLCLYRVNVIDNTINSPNPEPSPVGLELTAVIPKLDSSSRHKLKKDIHNIIKKVDVSTHPDQAIEQQIASSRNLQYAVVINDDKKDFSVVNVKLEGETDKEYYETMWDINCKIKSYSK